MANKYSEQVLWADSVHENVVRYIRVIHAMASGLRPNPELTICEQWPAKQGSLNPLPHHHHHHLEGLAAVGAVAGIFLIAIFFARFAFCSFKRTCCRLLAFGSSSRSCVIVGCNTTLYRCCKLKSLTSSIVRMSPAISYRLRAFVSNPNVL